MNRLAGLAAAIALMSSSAWAAKYNVRWVMIHEPSDTAEEAARDFSARIEKETGGDVAVEVLTRAQYKQKYNNGKTLSPHQAMRKIFDGGAEMGQTYTWMLGGESPALLSLGMPYLFRDYNHAEAVLEGPIGKRLLEPLVASSGLRGLAYTYSGGFGMVATTDREVRKPEDLSGLRLEVGRAPYAYGLETSLGVSPVTVSPDSFVPLAKAKLIDGIETTFARFAEYGNDKEAKYATNTEHYLLTTMIVVNEKFFQTLPENYRQIINKVAVEVARRERVHAVGLINDSRKKLEARGVKVIDLTAAEKKEWERALQPMYRVFERQVKKELIEEIRSTKGGAFTAQR